MAVVAKRFDVYLVNLDPTVGSEIQKTRPCLVISPDEMNRFTHKPPRLNAVETDPNDNKFFECAAALGAGAIVSGDKAVIEVNQYMDIQVYMCRQFIALFA